VLRRTRRRIRSLTFVRAAEMVRRGVFRMQSAELKITARFGVPTWR
jgi:hypothetical protein